MTKTNSITTKRALLSSALLYHLRRLFLYGITFHKTSRAATRECQMKKQQKALIHYSFYNCQVHVTYLLLEVSVIDCGSSKR